MKKTVFLIFFLLVLFPLFSMSLTYESTVQEYDSFPMLEKFYSVEENKLSDDSFWNDCKIEILTVSKEKPIYSWFGHCAVLVSLPNSRPIMYDWGTFSFGRGFFKNFALGNLWYFCSKSYGDIRIRDMKDKFRTISAIELNLTSQQKRAVLTFLETNSTPGYDVYLYKYFTDNCSTRVRDLLSYITDGDFEVWAKSQQGNTFRQETGRVVSCNDFVFWVFNLLEGPMEDKAATRWDEMFLPERLESALLDYGKLGTKQTFYSDFRNANLKNQTPSEVQSNLLFSVLLSISLSLIALIGLRKNNLVYKIEGFTVNLFFGLLGSVLLFMMLFTIHEPAYNNINIVFVNPVLIVLAVLTLTEKNRKFSVTVYRVLASLCVVLAVLKIVLPGVFIQQNWDQIITLFPYYAIHGLVKKSSYK